MNTSKSNKFAFLFLLVLPIIMNSCAVNHYKAGRKNVPGLEKQGDLKVGLSMNSKGATNLLFETPNSGNRIDANIAYSPVKNLGIMYNTNSNILSVDFYLFNIEAPISISRFHEFHAGYYKQLNETTLFEGYAYGAFGAIRPLDNETEFDVSQNKFGINAGILKKVNNWRFGFHSGLSRHGLSNLISDDFDFEQQNAIIIQNQQKLSSMYLEHALTVRYVIKDLEIEAQIGRINRVNSRNGSDYSYNRKNFSIGLLYNIDKLLVSG